MLEAGAAVAVFDVNENNELTSKHTERVKFFKVDITNTADVEAAVEGTVEWSKQTGWALGGVVNCAGVGIAGKVRYTSASLQFNKLLTNKFR